MASTFALTPANTTGDTPTNTSVAALDRSSERAELLAKVDLFSGLSRITLAKIAAYLDPVEFADRESACIAGEPGDSMYVVSRGVLGVFLTGSDGQHETRVATLGPGACFGEMALFTGEPRSATVRALGEAEALRLERSRFIDLLRGEPGIGLSISATLSRRLKDANVTITADRKIIAHTIEAHLGALLPEDRLRVLQAGVLEQVHLPALRALFDVEAETVAAHLSLIGVDLESHDHHVPVLRVLRAVFEREVGAEANAAYVHEAANRLLEAGCWDEALTLLTRDSSRQTFLNGLAQAVRAATPAESATLRRWIEHVSDTEAERDLALALARAGWHEANGQSERARDLLRHAESAGNVPNHDLRQRLSSEIIRLSALLDTALATVPAKRPWFWHGRQIRPSTGITVVTAIGFTVAAAVASPPSWPLFSCLGRPFHSGSPHCYLTFSSVPGLSSAGYCSAWPSRLRRSPVSVPPVG